MSTVACCTTAEVEHTLGMIVQAVRVVNRLAQHLLVERLAQRKDPITSSMPPKNAEIPVHLETCDLFVRVLLYECHNEYCQKPT